MCKNNEKHKIDAKVKSISVGDGKIKVKLSPNYEKDYLLVGKDEEMMLKRNAEKTYFYIKNCQIANIVTTHLREQMTFTVVEADNQPTSNDQASNDQAGNKKAGDEQKDKNYVIVGVELIYG